MNQLKVAIAGLGVVGTGVFKELVEHADLLKARTGKAIEVVALSDREADKDRGVDMSACAWYDDARVMAEQADYDVLVETIGGSSGVALDCVKKALSKACHVVTANKAMLAHHGHELATLAEKNNVCLGYEPAVAGGIPIIKAMTDGFTGNKINLVRGILNGTSNYILTTMREEGRPFADVLADAQRLGYAEADPTFDVEGVDAAHKLALLTSLAFGTKVNFDAIEMEGISHISVIDQQAATELGYSIKLLGVARHLGESISQSMGPALIAQSDMLSTVEGVFNAVHILGDYVGDSVLVGRGAGEKPTASAVVGDICDIAKGQIKPMFGIPAKDLIEMPVHPVANHQGEYYMRLRVVDGAVAKVTEHLEQQDITVNTTWHHPAEKGTTWFVVLIGDTVQGQINDVCLTLSALNGVVDNPYVMRIEKV